MNLVSFFTLLSLIITRVQAQSWSWSVVGSIYRPSFTLGQDIKLVERSNYKHVDAFAVGDNAKIYTVWWERYLSNTDKGWYEVPMSGLTIANTAVITPVWRVGNDLHLDIFA